MSSNIDGNDITVQVLSSQTDRSVHNGLATSNGRYDLDLYPTATIVPTQKINKTGDFILTPEFQQITGWTVDPAFAGTTIEGGGLRSGAVGSVMFSAQIKAQLHWANCRIQIRINGETIHESTITATNVVSKVLYLNAGDVITLWARRSDAVTGWWLFNPPTPSGRIIAAETYLKIEDYTDEGIDFQKDMVYGQNIGWYDDAWGRYVSPSYLKTGLPFVTEVAVTTSSSGNTTSYLSRGSVSGPILAQTRSPIPVFPGSKVNFKGTFRVRQTGTKDEKNPAGNDTGLQVRFSLWGIGVQTDEYGIETLYPHELMFYMATLQNAGVQTENMMEYILPTLPDATVPENVTSMFFTCSLVQTNGMTYGAGTFTSRQQQNAGQNVSPKSSAEMRYFGWSHAAPLEVKIDTSDVLFPVTKHPVSHTGVAFKNRRFFEGVDEETECVFFGFPNQATTVSIYDFDADTMTRGGLLGTFTANAGERKVVTINPAGNTIEMVSSGDYFVESVQNVEINDLNVVKTRFKTENYVDVINDISKISILREEAGTGSATIDFSTVTLDPSENDLLRVGKKVRVLARHYGEGNRNRPSGWSGEALFSELFTGSIRKIAGTYDYRDEPIVQVVAYDAIDRLDRLETRAAFDSFEKYGPYFVRTGFNCILEGYDWGGPNAPMPNEALLNPSATGDITLLQALIMTRNTNKMYIHVDAKNRIIIRRDLQEKDILFSDVAGQGDISYGKVERKSDSENVINQIVTNESVLDEADYADRSLSADRPPEDFRYPETKSQSGTYDNLESSREIGVMSKTFDVVRRVDSLRDLYDGKIGPGFKTWAEDLLASLSDTLVSIRSFNVPVRNSEEIYILSSLDLMDTVGILFKGETTRATIRGIEHTITPGRWLSKLSFAHKDPGTYW